MKKIIVCLVMLLVMDNVFPQTIWRTGIDLTNCFLQQNGDVHCYDSRTGRKFVLKRI